MNETISVWRSKSFWAGAIGFGASIAGLVGVKVDPANAAQLADLAPLIVTSVTSASGVVFRILADAKIGAASKSSHASAGATGD